MSAELEARERFAAAIARALEAHILCYPDAKALADVADGAQADWESAILASARERVEAVPEENEDVGNTHDELFARGFNAGRRAASAALSEDT